jgi:hypothetical protein
MPTKPLSPQARAHKRALARAWRERNRERLREQAHRHYKPTHNGEKPDAGFLVNELDSPLAALAAAVIWRAADDVRLSRTPGHSETPEYCTDVRASARAFFDSAWFAALAEGIGLDVDQVRALAWARIMPNASASPAAT